MPVIVILLPDVAPARGQFPLTVKLFKLIVGTAVMLALWSLLMTTSSPAAGVPPGLQLPAVAHEPPAVGTYVFVAALAVRAPPSRAMVNSISSGNCRDTR